MEPPKKLHLIDVPGWGALTVESRQHLLTTCVAGCGNKRDTKSELCSVCRSIVSKKNNREKVAAYRQRKKAAQ